MPKIILTRDDEGYVISETGRGEDNPILDFKAYSVKVGRTYLLCFENWEKDFWRAGSRKSDIEKVVFDTTTSPTEADKMLRKRATIQAIKLAEKRRYDFEDRTTE